MINAYSFKRFPLNLSKTQKEIRFSNHSNTLRFFFSCTKFRQTSELTKGRQNCKKTNSALLTMMYIHKLHAFVDWAFPNDQIKQVNYLQNYDNIFCKATKDRLHLTARLPYWCATTKKRIFPRLLAVSERVCNSINISPH